MANEAEFPEPGQRPYGETVQNYIDSGDADALEQAKAYTDEVDGETGDRVSTVEGALAGHISAPDPHPQYETSTEATSKANAAVTAHEGKADPHPVYETSTEAAAKITAHKAEADPHPVYETSAEVVARRLATAIGDGVNLNTLTTPGSYSRSSSTGVTAALNYPTDNWAGWLVVEANSGATSVLQRAYSIYSGNGASAVYRSVYWRTLAGGTWGPWVKMDIDLQGVGSPEGVVHASVGETYVDTAATNGARQWFKNAGVGPTGWVVSQGDTGSRSVPSIAATGFTATTSLWRRVGNTVTATIVMRADVAFTAGGTVMNIPVGFRPAISMNLPPPYSGSGPLAAQTSGGSALWTQLIAGDSRSWSFTWLTVDAWPTTLPGIAV